MFVVHNGRFVRLEKGQLTLGRSYDADVHIAAETVLLPVSGLSRLHL